VSVRLTVLVVCIALAVTFAGYRVAATQVATPRPEDLRFQLLGNEPIAAPDGRALVRGWSVLMFKDRRTGQCYVAFTRDDAISAMEAMECPS
jgi:hypothetical protein